MYDILKLNKISPVIGAEFSADYRCVDECADPDGILVRSAKMDEYEVGNKLVAIARAGAGVNNIPCEKMAEKGVVVFNTPGANANAVKELVLCSMLLASRDVIGGNKWVNTLSGDDVAKQAEKGKSAFAGTEIFGKTIGIIGLGAIGVLVAKSCLALGLKVLGYDPYMSEKSKAALPSEVKIASLDDIYEGSDFITIHVPLLDSTKNMINKDAFSKMKKGVILLNMARGGLVDLTALKEAIAGGIVRKYVIDFPEEAVLNCENIIVFPHLGASTEEAEDNCAVMAAKQLVEYIEKGNIVNSVNYPNLTKERTGKVRTCVLFDADKAEKINALDGDKAVALRGKYGYAIIDGEKEVTFDCSCGIKKIRVL